MNGILVLSVTAVAALLAVACAKPPTEAVSAAENSFAAAQAAGAEDYAPEAMSAAMTARAVLDAEIEADIAAGRYREATAGMISAKATLDRIIAGAQGTPYREPDDITPVS